MNHSMNKFKVFVNGQKLPTEVSANKSRIVAAECMQMQFPPPCAIERAPDLFGITFLIFILVYNGYSYCNVEKFVMNCGKTLRFRDKRIFPTLCTEASCLFPAEMKDTITK